MKDRLDRRRHARIDVVKAIFIEVMPPRGQRQSSVTVMRCETVDVSVKGLCLLVPERVEPGSQLNIAVPEEGWVENLELSGEARWLREAEEGEGYWLGLELEDTHLENMEKWFKIVTDLRGQEAIDEFDRL